MASLPIYDAGGTQRTDRMQGVQTNADMFGAAEGRAMAGVGQSLQGVGQQLLRIDEKEKRRQDAANVSEAAAAGSARMRQAMYGPGGLYERTGTLAEGVADTAKATSEQIRKEILGSLATDEQREAFNRVWTSYEDTAMNGAAKFEFDQRKAARTTGKAAVLENAQADVIAHYNDEEMILKNIDIARGTIRANADGLPAEAVAQLEREAISNLHLSVIQRMALDDPGRALDYYTRHKGAVNGVDHTKANAMIGKIAELREVRTFVDEVSGNGPANEIMDAVAFAETGGERDPSAAVSPKGASGEMQLMPGTARETAISLGLAHVAQMNDKELQAYWQTPEGRATNRRLGAHYLGQQLQRFSKDGKGDLEAAFVAYNAGPENAEKWLNAGRDYSVLPKPEETLPYVRRAMGAYRKVDLSNATTSEEIQRGLNGKKYYNGDAKGFLRTRLQKQHGDAHIDGMSDDLADRMAAMMNDAPDFVKAGLDILSGYRSPERQEQLWQQALRKYGSPEAARKWVAPPGNSQHNHGRAADLGWNGGALKNAPKEVVQWVHQNAGNYGLAFPLGNEPWHIETAEARGKRGRPQSSDPATRRIGEAFAASEGSSNEDSSGYVEMTRGEASAADLYTQSLEPFSVDVKIGSLEAALSAARERYADNPSKLAEAERQITNTIKERENASKAQVDGMKKALLAGLLQQGQSPRDADPSVLAAIGPEGVKQLFSLEDDIKQGGARFTDDATYIELTQMDPREFRDIDLLKYAEKLSRADLQKFADMQANLRRGNTAALEGATQSRQQIMANAQDILGLNPNKRPDDAKRLASLNRALDGRIADYVDREGKRPDGIVLQKMVDDLMIEGKIEQSFWMDKSGVRMFEVAPEDANRFYVAGTFDDIPPEAQGQIANTYTAIYQSPPDEEAAVGIYNDMLRVQAGGTPEPPAVFAAQVKQLFAKEFGRPPLPDEIASIYRRTLIGATEARYADQQ